MGVFCVNSKNDYDYYKLLRIPVYGHSSQKLFSTKLRKNSDAMNHSDKINIEDKSQMKFKHAKTLPRKISPESECIKKK